MMVAGDHNVESSLLFDSDFVFIAHCASLHIQ